VPWQAFWRKTILGLSMTGAFCGRRMLKMCCRTEEDYPLPPSVN
jgi:hypothetical protein